jgi:DnaA-homolog protein
MPEQLPLFRPRTDASFANFFVSPANVLVIHALRDWLARESILFYLYGATSSGRTHLLQAVCREYGALYLPLAELREQDPQQVLEGLENVGSICLDDIHAVINSNTWCEYLFHLFNRCAQSGAKLLISADRPSAQLPCVLPDLQSRLCSSGDFRLQALNDDECAQGLQLRARERGIDLGEEVVAYILARHTRAFPALLSVLEQLDKQSLAEKKRITIPFVRRVFDSSSTEN